MRIQSDSWLVRFFYAVVLLVPTIGQAQEGANPVPKEKLDQLTAQVALYPDSLLAQVLMASTYPADVAEAAAWSRAHADQQGDAAVKLVEEQPWDPSVQSLVAFPQVIIMMGEKPDWVQDLGDAFLAQPEDVMDSVQRLRTQAQKAGNLKSNEQQKVSTQPAEPRETGATVVRQSAPAQVIVIESARPEVVYVPSYNPTYVYGAWPYPAYPPYYVPYPPGYWFSGVVAGAVGVGIAWGVGVGISNALWGGCNWGRGNVNINVNHYNNIHVHRRLDGNNNRWSHNVQNRRGTPYRGGDATRQKLDRKYQAGQREQFRGRDADRARATQSLQNRGVKVDRGPARDRVQAMDRAGVGDRMHNLDRKGPNGRPVDRAAARDRTQPGDRQALQNRAQSANRDNAFRGAGDRQARDAIDRGGASRQAMQARSPQRPDAGARPQTRGGAGGSGRPQLQGGGARPQAGGGGGGARPQAGGGGGGARPQAGGGGGGARPQAGGGGGRPQGARGGGHAR